MIHKRLTTGMFGSNCYIVGDDNEGVIIDPGAPAEEILKAVEETGLKIKYIILTHAHIDHICSMAEVKARTGAQIMIHEEDYDSLVDPWLNGSKLFGFDYSFNSADIKLKDKDVVKVEGVELEIIHTPGHSPGCICIKAGNNIYTGDTLFRMSVGRTDLGNGSQEDLLYSLNNRLMTLNEDITVYPGHGTSTSIGYEKKHNPYL